MQTLPTLSRPTDAAPAALRTTATALARGARRHGWTAVRVAICVALAFAAVSAAGRIDASVQASDIPLLGVALALIALQVGALALAWSAIIGRLGNLPVESGLSTFVAGWLGRYIPGPQTGPAAKFAAARRLGVPTATTAGALILEQALQLTVLLVLVAVTIPVLAGPVGFGWAALALTGAAVIATGVLRPHWPARLCRRWLSRGPFAASLPRVDPIGLVRPALCFAAANALSGLSLHVLAVGLAGWSPTALADSVCIVALATLAGALAPVPSGLGVREGVIVGLMGPAIGAPGALTVAVLARALAVLLDAGLGAGVVAHRGARTLQRAARAVQASAGP